MSKPIYQIIENDIKEKIKNKELNPGDKILSENELKDKYDVSRMTVRQALNNLVNDGYLFKHKGKGTFVSKNKIEKSIHGVRGFTEEMEHLGRKVSNNLHSFEVITPSPKVREKLFLSEDDKVIFINRVRLADDIPVLLEELYVPYDLFKDLSKEDMEKSFYDYVEKNKKLQISHCLQKIEAAASNDEVSNSLKVNKNTPVLRIIRNTFLTSGRPFEYVVSTYRSDQYRFVQYAIKD